MSYLSSTHCIYKVHSNLFNFFFFFLGRRKIVTLCVALYVVALHKLNDLCTGTGAGAGAGTGIGTKW